MPYDLPSIFKTNPMEVLLCQARKDSARLAMHIRGKNVASAIETMDEFETEQKKNIRQKYCRSNRDVFARLHRPIDKVFSASGGSVTINLPDAQLKYFNKYLQKIRKGMSLRKWVQQLGIPAYQIDPNGIIFIEVDKQGRPYPTYKSTDDIFYYDLDGRKVNMVILKLTAAEVLSYGLDSSAYPSIVEMINKKKGSDGSYSGKYYRIVDDITDAIYEWDGKSLTEIPGLTINNMFFTCPGIIISDMYDFNSELLLSPDSEVVELANAILIQGSVFEIWKNLHMFPKHWRVQSICPKCQGNKMYAGAPCPDCEGTGFQKRSSVRDEIIVPIPDTADGKVSIPTQFDGYSAPQTDAWDLSVNDITRLFTLMFETLWGYSPESGKQNVKVSGDKKTATQIMDESNAKIQRLYGFSEWAETIEKFVIDMCATYMFPRTYSGCSVNYGDRYIMEGPDEIWLKYSTARKEGAAQAILDTLLQDYYESKYFGNPISLQVALRQMRVEPWVHSTFREVQAMSVTDLDKCRKMYFSEWKSSLIDMDWLTKTDQVLNDLLTAYATPKLATIAEEVALVAQQTAFEPAAVKKSLTGSVQ